MVDTYKNIEECNSNKKIKILIVFDDMISDMHNIKKLNKIVNALFTRGKKLNISIFITQSYFKVPKDVRLNTTHFFLMKIPNRRELAQIAYNHSSNIDSKDFMNLYKSLLQNHILFWLLILLLHYIILNVSERIF